MKIYDIVQRSDTTAGRTFDSFVLFLIIFSIITLSVETFAGLSSTTYKLLDLSEVVVTVLFTVEYILRVATAPSKKGYIFSFFGIIDLLAILPFYLALGIDFRSIRVFRLLRIFRILNNCQVQQCVGTFWKSSVVCQS